MKLIKSLLRQVGSYNRIKEQDRLKDSREGFRRAVVMPYFKPRDKRSKRK